MSNSVFGVPKTGLTGVNPARQWKPYTVNISATTTAPAKGTVVADQGYYIEVPERNSILIRYVYSQNGGGSGGTGDYLFSLPPGYVWDLSAGTVLNYTLSTNAPNMCGSAYISASSTSYFGFVAPPVSSANSGYFGIVFASVSSSFGYVGAASTFAALGTTLINYGCFAEIPVVSLLTK